MEIELILSFLGASVLLTLMPGPDNIFVLTESVTKGQRQGISISLGLVSGILVHTFAAATGLSLILQKSEIAFQIVQYLGVAYLLYLAYKAATEKAMELNFNEESSTHGFSFWKLVGKGFLMNVLNPKVSLFFIAFLPQFISPGGVNPIIQMVFLGFVFMVQALIIFSLISVLSGRLSAYLNSQRFWNTTKWIKAIILTALAIALALSSAS